MPFSEKAALTAPIEGTSGFAGKYARRPARAVLPDLDLDRRPFKPPCSHLIDSEVFDGLPGPLKSEVYRHLREILTRREAGPGSVRMLTGCAEVRDDVPRQPEFGPSERPARPRGCRESVRFAVTQDGREPWEQAMSFRGVFIAIFLGTALVVAAFLVNSRRPRVEFAQPTAALVRASGKCAECHRQETSAIVHEFEMSRHNEKGVNCLDCHQPAAGQDKMDHRGFVINAKVTAANCSGCHQTQYDQFLRSRHAAPAWASVTGKRDLSVEQIAFSEKYQPGGTDRPPHPVALVEGPTAMQNGCLKCHDVGRPNKDGSIGSCTACHARHVASVELARLPETCGQCHMGPDHSQVEIYHESKHGVLFNAQRPHMNLRADPKHLTTGDMPVPTCATCHMSGLEGQKFTHDVTERLSYYLFAAVSDKRPNYLQCRIHQAKGMNFPESVKLLA